MKVPTIVSQSATLCAPHLSKLARNTFALRHRGVLVGLLLYKLAFFGFTLLVIYFVPIFNTDAFRTREHWPPGNKPALSSYFATWDAAAYLKLSMTGYARGDPDAAFYPLLPTAIRYFAPYVGGNYFLAGFVLCNTVSIFAFYMFYAFVFCGYGESVARKGLILLLVFPGALFFSFIYTEPLFLLLLCLLLLALRQQRYGVAATFGYLLPLTRAIGIFTVLPVGWYWLRREISHTKAAQARSALPTRHAWALRSVGYLAEWKALVVVMAVLAGYASYFTIMWVSTGDPFEGFVAQRFYPNHPSIPNIFDLAGFVRHFATVEFWSHEATTSPIDRVMFLVFLATLPAIWRLDTGLFLYALGSGLIPAMSNWFVSYTRFVILCIPIYIVLGNYFSLPRRKTLFWGTVTALAVIQALLLVRHVNFYWSG